MLRTADSVVSTLQLLRGTYSQGRQPAETDLSQVVSLMGLFVAQVDSWIGRCQPLSLITVSETRISTETIMHDFAKMRRLEDQTSRAGNLPDLSGLVRYYNRKIAAVLSKVAFSSTTIADYYDVTPWADLINVPA